MPGISASARVRPAYISAVLTTRMATASTASWASWPEVGFSAVSSSTMTSANVEPAAIVGQSFTSVARCGPPARKVAVQPMKIPHTGRLSALPPMKAVVAARTEETISFGSRSRMDYPS